MKRVWLFVLLVMALIGSTLAVRAHSDGTAQLIGVDLGACQISAWTWPAPLVTNTPSHVSVLVTEKAEAGTTGEILLDSAVTVEFAPQDGSSALVSSEATHELADVKFFYETEELLATEGVWDVTVKVTDEATGCEGEASFAVPVEKGSLVGWYLWGGVAVLLVAALVFGWWRVQQKQKAG